MAVQHSLAVGSIVGDYLLGTARALNTDQFPPSKEHAETVMHAYFCEVATIRAAGLTQSLSANRVEQLFWETAPSQSFNNGSHGECSCKRGVVDPAVPVHADSR